ncbi:MAG: restriction endonuclease subunit S [Desulfobacteraceae bacterium]|nr:MAG: restriction endonuclease subunit S [Desulfobacteraceae bacterium]
MASEWQERPLGELTDNFDSIRIPIKETDRVAGPYPYYGASGIVDYIEKYLFDGEYLLIAEDGENLRTRNTPIAFMARGKFWVNNHAHIVRGNSNTNTRFLMYALAAMEITGYLTGSTMPKLTQSNMNRIPVISPPLKQQQAIACILGALDDKIELNRKMNQTLEAMARAIFKSWFVDFDPVRVNAEGRDTGLPKHIAKLFPDSFEDSELGEIPKGWKVGTIKENCPRIQYGFTTSASAEPSGPQFLRITDIRGGSVDWNSVPFCEASDDDKEKYRIIDGDIFVARTGASTGENVYIIDPPEAVFASYLVRFQFVEPGYARIVAEFMRSDIYREFVKSALGGSAQPNANAQTLASASLIFPSIQLADKFYELVRPMDLKRAEQDKESRTLATIRDILLPKLISGELRVLDAERIIESVL